MKKTVKRLLATIMTVVMILTAIPFSGIGFGVLFAPKASAKTIEEYSVGDIIEFGSYPQSRVTDSSLISAIEKAGSKLLWVDYGYYAGTGSSSDGNMKPVENMMRYKDIPYNGNMYRAVEINQYRPYCTGYMSSASNSFQDNNGYYIENTYYFKYEPLMWRVLDPAEGFVMCTTAIDAQPYNNYILRCSNDNDDEYDDYYGDSLKSYYSTNWEKSSIRKWLNNNFYNTAFSSTEKIQIRTTYNDNKSCSLDQYDSTYTLDKIFLLTYNDVLNIKYGFSQYDDESTKRQIKSTDYADCQGCVCLGPFNDERYYGNSRWYLRLPAYNSIEVPCVEIDGGSYEGCCVYYTYGGIVPAFKFNPKSTISESIYPESFYMNKSDKNAYKTFEVKYGESLEIPESPTKDGYTFTGWYDYYTDEIVDLSKETMDSTDGRSFYASWQANKYTATLKVDGKVYKEITYTYGQKSISLPAVPEKAGYTGEWESYSLGVGGVTINAVYTKIPADVKSVSVTGTDINYKGKAKLSTEINASGKYTKTFTSSNSSIVMVDNEGNIYGAKRGSAKITCTLTDSRGNTVSDTCTVNVTYTWWQWIVKIVLFGWIWY